MSKPLTKSQAAARCGTSEKTIERSVKNGKLRAHKIGGRLIVFEEDLDAFLARCANVPALTAAAGVGVSA
jgi:excisionase family DNA binding protein